MLNQAENRVKIEGLLAENDLKYGSYVRDGKNVDWVGGVIKVLVEQVVNGVPQSLEIPVHLFSQKLKNNGDLNPAYESIARLKEEFVSIASAGGRECADKVRITGAQIRMNEFFDKSGRFITEPRITASFVNKATGEFKPEANFSLTFAVSDIHPVVDKDGVEVEPKKVEVVAIVPGWQGRVELVKLYATNPNVINAIESYWEKDQSYKASGRLNFTSTTETYIEDVDFGEPVERQRTIRLNELIITGGSQAPLDESVGFDVDELVLAMKERKVRLDALKQKNMGGKLKAPAPAGGSRLSGDDLGF